MRVSWESLHNDVQCCGKCGLCKSRTHTAFGEGNLDADIMFVGEGPGREEDLQGRPFVGPAGQLLERMIAATGFRRDDVYITNVVKCRPPNNRNPVDDEAEACLPYLRAQYALIHPKIVVCLGAIAMRHLYDRDAKITRVRGQWLNKGGVWFIPTYHPAALLRDESKKRDAWADMQALLKKYTELAEK
ncbi:MAG: uracil-DNA glycosylase [Clostridia bacterium]